MNKASTDLATGLITCSECGEKYYSFTNIAHKHGKTYTYQYYKHFVKMLHITNCSQKKSFIVDNVNNIFYLFFVFYYLVFDDTIELLQESQRLIELKQMQLKEQIANYEKIDKQYEKQIKKFNSVLDETDDTIEIKILARRINETEEMIKVNSKDLMKTRIELEQLKEQYVGIETTNAYYNVQDRVKEFLDNNNEGQRDSLITVTKSCYIFSPYLIIDTGRIILVFNTESKYEFDKEIMLSLEKEKIYKERFVQSFVEKTAIDIMDVDKEQYLKDKIYKANEMVIAEFKLTGQNKQFNTQIVDLLFGKMGIKYDFSNHVNVLLFMDLK